MTSVRAPFTALLLFYMMSVAQAACAQATFLGMDRNEYPGGVNMQQMKKTFAFTGYWLNTPPGASANTWKGKRTELQKMGYGFLLLFNGRLYNELKASGDPATVGRLDAETATGAAQQEGFPKRAIIFLDQEQGGRMLPEQRAYIHAFVDGVTHAGYRAGIYCSGIPYRESGSTTVITADDIRDHAEGREIYFFISNDRCGPSKGCIFATRPPGPSESGVGFASVWQYAQSPRRPEMTAACRKTYAADGNCYPPGITPRSGLHADVESASSPDPSAARTR